MRSSGCQLGATGWFRYDVATAGLDPVTSAEIDELIIDPDDIDELVLSSLPQTSHVPAT